MVLTTELYEAVVKIVDDRIREIRVTREGFNALQQAVIQLAEAQRRTEERMGRLEVAIERLVEAQHQLGQQLGVLTDTIGFSLEDVAKVVLPSYLAKHLNVFVPELERRFFVVDKHEIEMNLYAEGWRGAESVIVLGESKSRIYKADVEKFLKCQAHRTFA